MRTIETILRDRNRQQKVVEREQQKLLLLNQEYQKALDTIYYNS